MKQYNKEKRKLFKDIMWAEETGKDIKDRFYTNYCNQILQEKINKYDLSIKFTDHALVVISILCKTSVATRILLIDCLDKFPKRLITAKNIILELYPNGFYTFKEIEAREKTIHANYRDGWNGIF